MENLILVITGIGMAISGFIAGELYQKWIYFKKTGEHLQNL